MVSIYRVSLTGTPETFTVTLAGVEYQLTVRWNAADEAGWVLDIAEPDEGDAIVCGVPLVTGADLLAPYGHLGFGGRLVVWSDSSDAPPDEGTLGNGVDLYFLPAWGGLMSQRLYDRRLSLIVGADGQGLELGEFRVVFQTHHADYETPNHADIRVYNLAEQTTRRIQREFTKVVLQAGYQETLGLVFGGNIRQVRRGRENGTDTYVDILASDGDKAYNYAVVNHTLAAGATANNQVDVAQGAMAEHGATRGHVPDLGGPALPRGKAMYGMARKFMRDAAASTDTTWSIQNGATQMVPVQGYLPGQAVTLTSMTGLVGQPEQTNEGIKVRALLDARFRVGGRVKLDNASILRFKTDLKVGAFHDTPRLDEDGLYRILAVDFTGDTRGNDWYADLICVGIDASAPIGSKLIDTNGGR